MQTSAVNPTTTGTTSPTGTTDVTGLTSSVSKQEFLNLLVTQLRQQDPLSPMNNDQFVAELAQFSTLEEMQNVSSATELSSQLMGSVNNAVATSFIGRSAVAETDSVNWPGEGKATLGVDMPSAGAARLEIYDANKRLVDSLNMGTLAAGTTTVSWDGKDQYGQQAPAGTYTLKVVAADAEGATLDATPLVSGTVGGVSFENGTTWLDIGGIRVPISSVKEIDA